MLNGKSILITGGTGSFGRRFVETILRKYNPARCIIFSRDEFKQSEMAKLFPLSKYPSIRYFLGDVRDKYRLFRAFEGVNYVVHAAALKQVPALEYNPTEAVKTNVLGSENIVDAAIDAGVEKVIALSTDKAVDPANLYGATKLVSEKIFIAAKNYAGNRVKFSVVRYGNVIGSRGSVVPIFLDLKRQGVKEFPVTDLNMTRFWMPIETGVDLVIRALASSQGGEIFVPKIPSMRIVDLARAIQPECEFKTIGIRPGEKMHEVLISQHESRFVRDIGDIFIVLPPSAELSESYREYGLYPSVPTGFVYESENTDNRLSVDKLRTMLSRFDPDFSVTGKPKQESLAKF